MSRDVAPESAYRYAACAWCGSVLDRETGGLVGADERPPEDALSHGICGTCLGRELRQRVNASSAGPMDARTLARQANEHFAATAESLHRDENGAPLIGFFCECGCLTTVMVTAREYRRRGAWLHSHRDPRGGL